MITDERFAHFTGVEVELLLDLFCLGGDEDAGRLLADYLGRIDRTGRYRRPQLHEEPPSASLSSMADNIPADTGPKWRHASQVRTVIAQCASL